MEQNTPSDPNTEEIIEQLSGAGYGPREIAIYLDIDVSDFMRQWKVPDSKIRYHYDRGQLLIEGQMSMSIAAAAAGGNITAAQQHMKMMAVKKFEAVQEKLLRGEL